MNFRIIGEHEHLGLHGGHRFLCVRTTLVQTEIVSYTWGAWKDNVLLKSGCRTLNEAKQACRAALAPQDRPA